LQVTLGCSHNRCAFCVTYKNKKFKARKKEDIFGEIDWARENLFKVTKVFLGDGDALALSTGKLTEILNYLYEKLPSLKRVSLYASPGNFKTKTLNELESLKKSGLSLIYVGLESGDDEILKMIDKGFSSSEMAQLCLKPQSAGLKMSATVILGLGGPELSKQHAKNTAKMVDIIKPRFLSALTLMNPYGDNVYRESIGLQSWRMLTPFETLEELRFLVDGIESTGIIFRSNHASNYLPLAGTFQKGKQSMLQKIDQALLGVTSLRPEYLRDL